MPGNAGEIVKIKPKSRIPLPSSGFGYLTVGNSASGSTCAGTGISLKTWIGHIKHQAPISIPISMATKLAHTTRRVWCGVEF